MVSWVDQFTLFLFTLSGTHLLPFRPWALAGQSATKISAIAALPCLCHCVWQLGLLVGIYLGDLSHPVGPAATTLVAEQVEPGQGLRLLPALGRDGGGPSTWRCLARSWTSGTFSKPWPASSCSTSSCWPSSTWSSTWSTRAPNLSRNRDLWRPDTWAGQSQATAQQVRQRLGLSLVVAEITPFS